MRLNKGDKIVLGGGTGIVCLDCNDRVYFRWKNGDLCWVYRKNIIDVKRKKKNVNNVENSEYQIVDISKRAEEIREQKIAEFKAIIGEKQIICDNLSLAVLWSKNRLVEKCLLSSELVKLREKLAILMASKNI